MTNVIELAQKLVQYRSHSPQLFPVFSYLKTYLEADGFNVRLFDLEMIITQKLPDCLPLWDREENIFYSPDIWI